MPFLLTVPLARVGTAWATTKEKRNQDGIVFPQPYIYINSKQTPPWAAEAAAAASIHQIQMNKHRSNDVIVHCHFVVCCCLFVYKWVSIEAINQMSEYRPPSSHPLFWLKKVYWTECFCVCCLFCCCHPLLLVTTSCFCLIGLDWIGLDCCCLCHHCQWLIDGFSSSIKINDRLHTLISCL